MTPHPHLSALGLFLGLFQEANEAAIATDFVTRLLRVQTTASVLLLTAMLALRWAGRERLGLGRPRHLIVAAIACFAASTTANAVLMTVMFREGDHSPLIWFSFLASLGCAVLAFAGRGPARAVALAGGALIALTWTPFLYAFAIVPATGTH